MNDCCSNCKFFIPRRYLRRSTPMKGFCERHFVSRLSDGYKILMDVILADEYKCELYESAPPVALPVYSVATDGETYLLPPQVVEELIKQGWVLAKMEDKSILQKA